MTDNNSEISGVAERYARALFDLSLEEKAIDATEADLGRIEAIMNESEDFMRLVKSPVFTSDEQLAAVSALLDKAKIEGIVGNFVRVVTSNRRLFSLPGIIKAFRKILSNHRGEQVAEVTSAQPLSNDELEALKASIKDALGKDIAIDAKVDPELLGGLVVKVGSQMIDSSVRTKLNSLKIALKEVG
ncbi:MULTISPECIES: F0F1 ATP synthase subunit delta [Cohaesibacter]|uniref:F0F1 ATP synthase subunit delta n=1 Tax=Cohaesibacter TaxID=655352 RepID=UPI000DEBE838|nr:MULTISPECIES: F0F1 ATP synthase subunit delta [Cohaesibacter]TLP46919.1 F0F1 ATP synthase subunit delta [Cohaesibacter sp. CAU 1516]